MKTNKEKIFVLLLTVFAIHSIYMQWKISEIESSFYYEQEEIRVNADAEIYRLKEEIINLKEQIESLENFNLRRLRE